MLRMSRLGGVFAVGLTMVLSCSRAVDWPQWGGPTRDFKVATSGLADRWADGGPKQLWKRPLGAGYSSIAAAGDLILTMYKKGDHDAIVALGKGTGQTVWEHTYAAPLLEGQTSQYGVGPNASLLIIDDRLIAVGFSGKMHCLSLALGKVIWSHDLVTDFGGKVHEFGYSASPITYKGNVIVLVGGEKNGVIALSPADGSVRWKSKPYDVSYASPIIINVDGQDQLVFFSSTEIIGLDPTNGTFLWKHPCVNQYKNNVTDPIWGSDNLLWVSTQQDGGTRVLRLDVKNGKTTVAQVWFNEKIKVFHWNAIRLGEYVYASIGGSTTMFAAINVKTGEVSWRERGFHKALCVYADNKLILLDENGQLALARVSPEKLEVLSKHQLTEKVSWTVPTLVGSTLYVRDTKSIMALDLGS